MLICTPAGQFRKPRNSISRIFVPINFDAARSKGIELVANMRQLERLGNFWTFSVMR